MANVGVSFRGSAGGATDPADVTYCLGGNPGGFTGDYYPITRSGITFGWSAGVAASSDRAGATDARLKGMNYNSTTDGATFRIDLPATGTYRVYVALGDGEGGLTSTDQTVVIKDNITTKVTIGPKDMTALGANAYYDANGTKRSEAQWVADSVYGGVASADLTFASTIVNVEFTSTAGYWGIAHLFLESVTGGAGPTLSVSLGEPSISGSSF